MAKNVNFTTKKFCEFPEVAPNGPFGPEGAIFDYQGTPYPYEIDYDNRVVFTSDRENGSF